jgi:hypothetical protein
MPEKEYHFQYILCTIARTFVFMLSNPFYMVFRAVCLCSFIVSAMAMLTACQPDGPRPYTYPNPEFDALRNSGVEYRIERGGYGVDTLHVTAQGVEHVQQGFMYAGRTRYDNRNFVQTSYFRSDISDQHHIMLYHFRDARHLVQELVEIDGDRWRDRQAIVAPIDTTVNILEFDDAGRLTRKIDSVQNIVVVFTYNDRGLLATCTTQRNEPDSWSFRSSYNYDTKGRLMKAIAYRRVDSTSTTYYYSQGLLDSVVSSGEYGTSFRYDHIFYRK